MPYHTAFSLIQRQNYLLHSYHLQYQTRHGRYDASYENFLSRKPSNESLKSTKSDKKYRNYYEEPNKKYKKRDKH